MAQRSDTFGGGRKHLLLPENVCAWVRGCMSGDALKLSACVGRCSLVNVLQMSRRGLNPKACALQPPLYFEPKSAHNVV